MHWLSLLSKKTSDRASDVSVEDYCTTQVPIALGRFRPRRVKDTDWAPVSSIVVVWSDLTGKGEVIPVRVLRTLQAVRTVSGDDDDAPLSSENSICITHIIALIGCC